MKISAKNHMYEGISLKSAGPEISLKSVGQ